MTFELRFNDKKEPDTQGHGEESSETEGGTSPV